MTKYVHLSNLAPEKLGKQTINSDFLSAQSVVDAFNNVYANLSVSGKTTSGTSGILSTYVISQNGEDIISIDIPVDKVIDSAEVVKDPDGQRPGTYIKIKIQNVVDPKFIPVPTLVNTYEGINSDTITTVAREIYNTETSSYSYKISAYVNNGSIEQKHLADGLSCEISSLRTDIDLISSQVSSYTNDWKASVDISASELDDKIDAEITRATAADSYISSEVDGKTTENDIKRLIHDTMNPYLSDYADMDLGQVPIENIAKTISALYKLYPES